MRPRLPALLAIAATLASGAAWAVPDLSRAESLVRAGQAEEAWTLLSPHEFDLAGREDFDYLLGVAALDSGRAARASLAFERVLAVNPNHAAARLDLARAHFALGDRARARTEFEAVLRFDPPPPARATIERYLAAIAGVGEASATRLSAYLEGTVGHDSNLNAGASNGGFHLPLFAATIASSRKSSPYAALGAGVDLTRTVAGRLDVLGGLDLRQRTNGQAWVDTTQVRRTDFYDTRSLDGRLGLQWRATPAHALRLTMSHGDHRLNLGDPYRRTTGLLAEWRHTLDSHRQWGAFALGQRIRYGTVDGTSYRMYGGDQLIAGVGGVRVLLPSRATFLYGSVYGGTERASDVAAGNLDGGKRLAGLRAGGQHGVLPTVVLQASLGVLGSRYDTENPLFLARREDVQMDLVLGAQWRFARDWQLKPQYQFTRSDSNFGAYDYRRHDVSLTLRYEWR